MLAAQKLTELPETHVIGAYTFGTPKVFDSREAQNYDEQGLADRTWRIVNHSDVFDSFPNAKWLPQYEHTGNIIYLSSDGELCPQPSTNVFQNDRGRVFRFKEFLARGYKAQPIADHSIRSYAKALYMNQKSS